MRLRKHASKLLGWAYSSHFHSSTFPEAQHCWPPPPPESDAGEVQCQLNQSPWDAIESPRCTNSEEEFPKPNEEEEEEVKPNILIKISSKSKEDKEEEGHESLLEEIVNDDKMQSTNSKESTESEMEIAVMKCKKTDGKGWHCKRAAQIPHSLCSYHLTQVRSYRNRLEEQIYGNGSRGNSKRRLKPAAAAVETGGVDSNYYYYSVIGPWWGKRRGPIEVRESLDQSDVSVQENDIHNGGVAKEEEVDDDDGRRCEERVRYIKKRQFKKKKKKRGRKPVKARSLKSLL